MTAVIRWNDFVGQSEKYLDNRTYVRYNIFMESTHDRVVASRVYETGLPEYIGGEVALMTAFEIISIFLGILALLMSFGSLLIALLAFLDKRNKHK